MCTTLTQDVRVSKKGRKAYTFRVRSEEGLRSPFQPFYWSIGIEDEAFISYPPLTKYRIKHPDYKKDEKVGAGYFHCYPNKKSAFWALRMLEKYGYWDAIGVFEKEVELHLFECSIPPGSKIALGYASGVSPALDAFSSIVTSHLTLLKSIKIRRFTLRIINNSKETKMEVLL